MAKEIGCKFIETSSGLDHNVDELLVGIVAQVKLNPQRIRNLSEKQRNSLCMTGQQKYKAAPDHFTELRRNERNKSNKARGAARAKSKGAKGANKENVDDDFEDESDDERSSNDGDESDIEKYFNLDEKTPQHVAESGESSTALNLNKLLNSRRHATPGMSTHFGVVNPFYAANSNNNLHLSASNNNISSSSCSTPTSIYPPGVSSISPCQTKTNKRDLTSYDSNKSVSQPVTPKKSTASDSDTSDRCINRLSSRTKLFLTSFLKFKRSLRVKRRNSNSCSDLFVIWECARNSFLLSPIELFVFWKNAIQVAPVEKLE